MSEFFDAVRGLLDGFAVGEERTLRENRYVGRCGDRDGYRLSRDWLRREGEDLFVRGVSDREEARGKATSFEIARWSERGLVDALLSESHTRGWLGLPTPTSAERVDRAIERLRAGEVFRQGGSDGGEPRMGGTSGSSTTLRAEGESFVHEEEGFFQPFGGEVQTVNASTKRMTEPELRAAFTSDWSLRHLVGLP